MTQTTIAQPMLDDFGITKERYNHIREILLKQTVLNFRSHSAESDYAASDKHFSKAALKTIELLALTGLEVTCLGFAIMELVDDMGASTIAFLITDAPNIPELDAWLNDDKPTGFKEMNKILRKIIADKFADRIFGDEKAGA